MARLVLLILSALLVCAPAYAQKWRDLAEPGALPTNVRPAQLVGVDIAERLNQQVDLNLEFTAEAGPGGFIFVPPFVPHQEINALDDEPLECVLTRRPPMWARPSGRTPAASVSHSRRLFIVAAPVA